MKMTFKIALLLAAALAFAPPVLAQTTSATVVAACGTPPAAYAPGANRALTQDTTGKLCDGSSGGGSTTANQGTPNAGGAQSWPMDLQRYNGAAVGNTNPVFVAPGASTPAQLGTTGSSQVLCAAACTLYSASVTITTASGYLLIYNATAAPADGAVTPRVCLPVTSNGTNGFLSANWSNGKTFSTGATAAFSSTGCFTQTLATAAFINGDAK